MILYYHFIYTDAHDNEFEFDNYEYKPTTAEIEFGWVEFLANTDTTEAEEACGEEDCDLRDYYEDEFTEFMHDYCEESARDVFDNDDEVMDQVNDAIEYRRDPYAYYGVSRSDFF